MFYSGYKFCFFKCAFFTWEVDGIKRHPRGVVEVVFAMSTLRASFSRSLDPCWSALAAALRLISGWKADFWL